MHNSSPPNGLQSDGKVIALGKQARELLDVTELMPENGAFIGKVIERDGTITPFPAKTSRWWQRLEQVPASIADLFAYLCEARARNICHIRGAPANITRQITRKIKAGLYGSEDRGDHGFLDVPSRVFVLDGDGIPMRWRDDPEGAVRNLVMLLGEPWCSASYVWSFSAKHGLELDAGERWTGAISDGEVRLRLSFIADRAMDEAEAVALTKIARLQIPKFDLAISRTVQINYIKRPHWVEHPDRDPLGDIPTIGWVRGKHEYLAVPENLVEVARWAKAQGHDVVIAEHPDAVSAVRSVGVDGNVRSHLMAAVMHLLLAQAIPDTEDFFDYSGAVVTKLAKLVERHRAEIIGNLIPFGRAFGDVQTYLPDNMVSWAYWLLIHPGALKRKTIKLIKEARTETKARVSRKAIFARVASEIEQGCFGARDPWERFCSEQLGTAPVRLVVAATGTRKSTLMRAAAVRFVHENPGQSVAFLVPRHNLGTEQIKMLLQEHPESGVRAAVWRGRHADDPDAPDPKHPGKFLKMCRRSEEVEEVEMLLLDVEHSMCKQGRGPKAIKCPLYDNCRYQKQKEIKADIWFAAHECMTHQAPETLGQIGLVLIDESPLDACVFGVDSNNKVTLPLDILGMHASDRQLWDGRKALHRGLNKLQILRDQYRGLPVSRADLSSFIDSRDGNKITLSEYDADRLRFMELDAKVKPIIRPDMSEKELKIELLKAAGNSELKRRATLWQLIEQANENERELQGRVQMHRGEDGRLIRMVGLREIAKGWKVRTLICDATGDAELLRAVWPQLTTDETVQGWQQLPRPPNVRIFQCVNRTISKWAVAVEGKHPEEIERKADGARRLYAAILRQALSYGGAPVAVVTYKSTEEWIRKNCCVPDWLTLMHFGDVTGVNVLQHVRALFVVGRPLAPPETVVRQTEALFGDYIAEREYQVRPKQGRIPTVADAAGNNAILVDVREHPHPLAERMRRQITEAALIQAIGRARAGLRGASEPLDLLLWTDVPLPELGPVEPQLWSQLDAGLDGLMLATGGVWLETPTHAAEAYPGLFTVNGVKAARRKQTGCFPNKDSLLEKHPVWILRYQRAGARQHLATATAVIDLPAARAWLEDKLGPLARFEVVEPGGKAEAG